LLLIDASHGFEAQTVANANLAISHGLTTIPMIHKINLPGMHVEDVLAIPREEAHWTSAKSNIGVEHIMNAIVD
jgi:GTP-binding protein LepA